LTGCPLTRLGPSTRGSRIIRTTASTQDDGTGPADAGAGRAALLAAITALFALQAIPGAAEALEYRRTLLAAQPWRLVTAHWIHLGWLHLVVNAVAWWIVARLFAPDLRPREQFAILGLSMPVIGAALAVLWPQVACASWLARELAPRPGASPFPWLAVALFAGGWIKVASEQPAPGGSGHAAWLGADVVTQAHLAGAVFGTIAGSWVGFSRRRAARGSATIDAGR